MLLFIQLVFCFTNILSQILPTRSYSLTKNINKPVIDSFALNHWIHLGYDWDVRISNDGKYFAYIIRNMPTGSSSLVIQSTTDSWKKEYPNAVPLFFLKNSKQFVFANGDMLGFLTMGANNATYIPGIASFKKPTFNWAGMKNVEGEWLAWQEKNETKELVLKNLLTGNERRFNDVADYELPGTGKTLFLKTKKIKGDSVSSALVIVDLEREAISNIWSSEKNNGILSSYSIDDSGEQIAFILQEPFVSKSISKMEGEDNKKDQFTNSIWYYRVGMKKPIIKVSNQSPGIISGTLIDGGLSFTRDGKYILFSLKKKQEKPKLKSSSVEVDVWHYRDTFLQTTQLHQSYEKVYQAVINPDDSQVIALFHDYEILKSINSDFSVIGRDVAGDRFWSKNYKKDVNWLIRLKNGSRKQLKTSANNFWFSPGGKYLVYFDAEQQCNYFSYDLQAGEEVNISKLVPAWRLGYEDEYKPSIKKPQFIVGIAGWLEDDAGILVYDKYDIWLLDLTGKIPPTNITNSYGRLHNIKFRLTDEKWPMIVHPDSTMLLTAFNTVNKQNGFYQKAIRAKGNPKLLYMGPCILSLRGPIMLTIGIPNYYDLGMAPIKAQDANLWIVKRQSATEAPNYYSTSDFKNYKKITNLQPQLEYNWLTTELVSFKQVDGTISQGILYKPENFDPAKRYPIIFTYYQQLSHRLYQYPQPTLMYDANIDIPWFVSRGYLVFTPDIYFSDGRMGKSAYNTVVGAAQHLKKLPFVDANRMGISGHSFGGRLTNYIVTHTSLFAAAFEGAGVSDEISAALQLDGISGGKQGSRLGHHEISYTGGEVSIWEKPIQWLDESPVLNANKVETPLLIFHCKDDTAVPWAQGVEMFVALRRMEKKVWMLQYDKEGHNLLDKKNCEDLTIRVTQFFDHYLKGISPPKWMTQGIPASLKGVENGLELDLRGTQP